MAFVDGANLVWNIPSVQPAFRTKQKQRQKGNEPAEL